MEVDNRAKAFTILCEGFFTPEDGKDFIEEYNRKVKSINTSEYSLIVDSKGVKASTPEVASALQNVISMYIDVPFKNRFMVKLESGIAQSQVMRLGKSIPGFDSLSFVNSKEEALSKL